MANFEPSITPFKLVFKIESISFSSNSHIGFGGWLIPALLIHISIFWNVLTAKSTRPWMSFSEETLPAKLSAFDLLSSFLRLSNEDFKRS